MPDYLTGRQREGVFAGTIGGTIVGVYVSGMPPRWDRSTTRHGGIGLLLQFTAQGTIAPLSYTSELPWARSLTATLGGGLPSGGTSGTVADAGTAFSPGPLNLDCSGSFNVSVPLEEVFRIEYGSATMSYGGTAITDWPVVANARFFERLRPGGTASASVTFGTLSVSLTKVIGTADGVSIGDDGQTSADVYMYGLAGTAYTGGSVFGEPIAVSLSGGNSYGTASATNGAQAIGYGTTGHVSSNVRRWATRAYELNGLFRTAADSPYSEIVTSPMVLDWTPRGSVESLYVTGGSVGTAWAQERYAAGLNAGPVGSESSLGSASLNQHGSVRLSVNQAWLASEGRDLREWRILQRGRRFGGFSISQSGTVAFDGGFNHVGGGTTTRNYGTVQSLAGYRFLECFTNRPNEQTVSLRIGTKVYVGTGYPDGRIRFDLCGPVNGTATADPMKSRWPLPTSDDTLGTPGVYWGKQLAGTVAFTGGSAGTVAIGTVALVRAGSAPVFHVGPEQSVTFTRYVAGGGTVRRFIYADVDGKAGLELPDAYPPTALTISLLVSEVNQIGTAAWDSGGTVWRGWTATMDPSIDYADGGSATLWGTAFLNKNRPATWVAGGGLYRDGTVWKVYAGTSVGTVPSQVLVDTIETYGRSGDGWGLTGTAYGTAPFQIAAGRWFRGVVGGIAYTNPPVPNVGVLVTGKGLTGHSDSIGTADSIGRYVTGPPALHGTGVHTIIAGTASVVYPVHYPLPQRLVWSVVQADDWITYDVSAATRHLRCFRRGSAIWAGSGQDAEATSWNEYPSGLSGNRPCLRVWRRTLDNRLALVYENGGTILYRLSPDEGRSWSMAGTITTSGEYPEMVITADGRQYVYWFSGGTIYGRGFDANGNPIGGTATIVTGAQQKFAVQEHVLGWAGWRMHLTYRTAAGALVDLISADGLNFS